MKDTELTRKLIESTGHDFSPDDCYISSYNRHYTLMLDNGVQVFPNYELLLLAVKERDEE